MRSDTARADRHHAVRVAADGWRKAAAIDDGVLRAIEASFSDDRVRLGLGLRVLAGFAALAGGCAFATLLALVIDPPGRTATAFAASLAALFTFATEVQIGRLRRAQAGAEYATAILAATCAGIAWVSLFDVPSGVEVFAGFAAGCALAAWRWGYALLAAVAAACILGALSQGRLGRATWFVLGIAALPMIIRFARSARWPPSHRRCFEAASIVFLAGAYVAVNRYALDHRWIEWIGDAGGTEPSAWARRAAIAGTILLPPLVLYLGVLFRDRALLALGTLFTAVSLVTLRHYHPIGPWWLSLVLGGGACLALALVVRRWLDANPGRERFGFTATPLFEDRRLVETAQVAATIVAMSPGPRVSPERPFEGGGGRSGGGGATGGT